MRISDWSSDVCSSDLIPDQTTAPETVGFKEANDQIQISLKALPRRESLLAQRCREEVANVREILVQHFATKQFLGREGIREGPLGYASLREDRKSVGKGKGVSVGVELGGRRSN